MNKFVLDQAFDSLGSELGEKVSIVVAGSAMFVITGMLADSEANDCDLVCIEPTERRDALLQAADRVRLAIDLEEHWLNDAMTTWQEREDENRNDEEEHDEEFPAGWKHRILGYKTFGNLEVKCISRLDAIALKARTTQERGDREGFEKDLSMLEAMAPSNEDLDFAVNYLNGLTDIDYSRMIVALQTMKRPSNPSQQ